MKYLKSKYAKWIMFTHAALMYIVFIASLTTPAIVAIKFAILTLCFACLTVSYVRDEDADKGFEIISQHEIFTNKREKEII